MKVKVFAVVYSDNFAALANDELTANYSRCDGIYTSREKAIAAAEREAELFGDGETRRILRKAEDSGLTGHGIEVFQSVYVTEKADGTRLEEVEASFHVTEHELELDEPKRARRSWRQKARRNGARARRWRVPSNVRGPADSPAGGGTA
jgi:hypothetical protein